MDVDPRRLKELRRRVHAAAIPPATERSLRIATWNIREFGRRPRRPESLVYIAEIIRSFDLVAIVELRENLGDLERVLAHAGPTWRKVFTAPLFDAGGNRERACYVYDSARITHTGLASNAQAPRTKRGAEYLAKIAWWRPPFFASFRAIGENGAKARELLLLTAHVRWASNTKLREVELGLLADWIATEVAKDPFAQARQVVALGDFNIPSLDSPLFKAVTSRGLTMPAALAGVHGSNLAKSKRYDQILFTQADSGAAGQGGVVDFYARDIAGLYPRSVDARAFTYEMSDHLPLWLVV